MKIFEIHENWQLKEKYDPSIYQELGLIRDLLKDQSQYSQESIPTVDLVLINNRPQAQIREESVCNRLPNVIVCRD